MKTQVQKWGNSLAVRIPKVFAEEIGIEAESEIELSLVNGKLVINVTDEKYTLEELVSQITPENRHEEIDWGTPVGKERF